jgi:predicted DNA-binding transcriptional regulator AlpA
MANSIEVKEMIVKREIFEVWNAIDSGQGFTSIDELSHAMNISPATIYNYIKNNTLPTPSKIGGRRLFVNSKLKKILAELTGEEAT